MTAMLHCSACGISASTACACGAPYVSAGKIAARAVAEHPEKSDRAIADELGIDHKTVGRARRKSTGDNAPVGKRVGKDGKARKLPKKSDGGRAGRATASACTTSDPERDHDEGDPPEKIWRDQLDYRTREA